MNVCPECEATIPPDFVPRDLCPSCLLKLGLRQVIGEEDSTPDTESPADSSDSGGRATVGEQFGPYKTIRILGEGGMGTVYLADQQKPIRRRVALKVIKLGMNTREVIARFESERQALALMDHPNIAHVFDAGVSEQGQPYFAMEYVDGRHITDYCDKNQLSNRERMELFVEVCHAVQHAHQKGVIHRDIKPSNILVSDRDGKAFPQVIDFGIAKATDQRLAEYSVFTRFGQLIGTPEYMSPEQAELGVRNVDTTTDVYSLGVLLYQLLVGALPFEAMHLRAPGVEELLRVIREEEPPTPLSRLAGLKDTVQIAVNRRSDPAAMRRQLAGDLNCIILKAIEKDKERRYASASDLAGDIRRYLEDQPVLARPPSAAYRTLKYIRRLPHKPFYAVLVAVVILAVITEWGVFRWGRLKMPPAAGGVTERQLTINIPENRAFGSNISHDGKQLAFIDTKGLHVRLIDSGEIRDIPFPAEILRRLVSVKWFPDDERLLVANSDEMWITSILGGGPHKLQTGVPSGESGIDMPDPEGGESAAVSPDGSAIALVRHKNHESDELWIVGSNGQNPRRVLTSKDGHIFSQAWSPDGERLAYATADHAGARIETVSVRGGPSRVVISDESVVTDLKTNLLWLHDGRLIFVLGDEENLWAIRTDSRTGMPLGKAAKITGWSGINVGALSASKDGRRLAVSKHHNRDDVYVGKLGEKNTRLDVVGRLAMSDSLDYPSGWTRDSRAVLFESSRTGRYQIFEQQPGKDNAEHLSPGPDNQQSAQLSPDGAWILYWELATEMPTSMRLMRLPISGGSAQRVLAVPVAAHPSFDCPSEGGFCVVTQNEQGHLTSYILDPLKGLGRRLASLQVPGVPQGVRVSPGGESLALGSPHGIKTLSLHDGTERNIKLPDGLYLWSFAWVADGTAFFATVTRTTDNSYLIIRVEPNGKTHTLLDRGRSEWLYLVVPSPDGRYVAFSQMTFENNVWLLENF